jgi:hypothetical protein
MLGLLASGALYSDRTCSPELLTRAFEIGVAALPQRLGAVRGASFHHRTPTT